MKCSTIARLLITCPDQPGIVSAITTFLYHHGANITMLDQHSSDPEDGAFFMRLEFQTPHLDIDRNALEQAFSVAVADKFEMQWYISYARDRKQMALMVSRHDHALQEILWRNQREELPADITMVISNHPDLEEEVRHFDTLTEQQMNDEIMPDFEDGDYIVHEDYGIGMYMGLKHMSFGSREGEYLYILWDSWGYLGGR